jgi:hypothetical protein
MHTTQHYRFFHGIKIIPQHFPLIPYLRLDWVKVKAADVSEHDAEEEEEDEEDEKE